MSEKPVSFTATLGTSDATVAESFRAFAEEHKVQIATRIWIPGSLMSFRDVRAMLQCLFYVNDLPGGEAHHDGGMKGRDAQAVLAKIPGREVQ